MARLAQPCQLQNHVGSLSDQDESQSGLGGREQSAAPHAVWNMLQVLECGASLLLSLILDSVLQPSACHGPLEWGHFQANWYELPAVVCETSGMCLLLIVCSVLVEPVVTCFL